MKLAVTGCNGSIGKRVVASCLKLGHTVVGIDISPRADQEVSASYQFHRVDLKDYNETKRALQSCEGIVHLAAFPDPGDYEVLVHNSNVVISWNVLRAAAELGITRIAQASSLNVITFSFSIKPHFYYFPIDEMHPCLPDEPYGLSKVICELQADTIVRRYPATRIASMRLHWSVRSRAQTQSRETIRAINELWGYVQEDSVADAFLLAVTEENGKWSGHERFIIAAPEISVDSDSKVLRKTHWPDVPIKEGEDISGRKGFFNCGKAAELLGWKHNDFAQI